MAKILFFNFDGTGQDASDANQGNKLLGGSEDKNISNILKFHLLLGGKLLNETGDSELEGGSRSFYYQGIGTYGKLLHRGLDAGLAFEFSDVATILRGARKDLAKYYRKSGDYDFIVVTGFSRGAALARRFAAIIDDIVSEPIIIEAVFDTVASIGLPDLSRSRRPSSDVVFEHGRSLPRNVIKALHLVSLDDKRKAFQPTLMNRDKRVTEIWFAGAHSDVGGGYYCDGLSDNTLRFFLDWFENQPELKLKFKNPVDIEYDKIVAGGKAFVSLDDVIIDANPFSVNHQQVRPPIIDKLTLSDRICCTIRNDKIVDDLPLVHHSVAERIFRDHKYRPNSLKNCHHFIYYQDGNTQSFNGISEHIRVYRGRDLNPDKAGIETRIYAYLKYNHTNIHLEAGKPYKIEVIDQDKQKWRDGNISAVDGRGWNRHNVKLSLFLEGIVAAAEPFRRVRKKADWFTLCGCIDEDDKHPFVIGNTLENFVPTKSGEFCAFANDVSTHYKNNSGYLKVRVSAM